MVVKMMHEELTKLANHTEDSMRRAVTTSTNLHTEHLLGLHHQFQNNLQSLKKLHEGEKQQLRRGIDERVRGRQPCCIVSLQRSPCDVAGARCQHRCGPCEAKPWMSIAAPPTYYTRYCHPMPFPCSTRALAHCENLRVVAETHEQLEEGAGGDSAVTRA